MGLPMKDNLDSYTVAQLQVAWSLAVQFENIQDMRDILRRQIDRRTEPANVPQVDHSRCPTTGCHGILRFWPKSSAEAGVPIEGCTMCMFSRVRP